MEKGQASKPRLKGVFTVKARKNSGSKLAYFVLCVPLVLAFASWYYLPSLLEWLVYRVFGYLPSLDSANWIWYWSVRFFYTWYVFLAVGVAGVWVIAAALAKREIDRGKRFFYPTVSFIVPAFNEDSNVSRCVSSLYKCSERYSGTCEVVVVDDGSTDYTYEFAWASIESNRRRRPRVRGRVIRHAVNLGKTEAIRSGVNSALGEMIAIVDADSWWLPDTLARLVDYMLSNGKKAATGYVHPYDGDYEFNPYVVLQQLEYSQGLGITRRAQSLGNNVLVVSGAIGLYDACVLRSILTDKSIHSVTEDLEVTLEMHKRGAKVGYASNATSLTVVPNSLRKLWHQRMRWFGGWLDNTLRIHRSLFLKKSWLSVLLWYCYIFEYGGAFIDLAALLSFPFLFWFSPDRTLFVAGLLFFVPYSLLISVVSQMIALRYAYSGHNYLVLIFYAPFYAILRFINIVARLTSSFRFLFGNNGSWHHTK